MTRAWIPVLFTLMLLAALPALAQIDVSGFGSALTISVDPAHPAPGQQVTLTAQSPILDLDDSDIEWNINGKPAGSGSSITYTLGGLGSQTSATVSVSGANVNDAAQITIVPTSIDLLFESNSYTPPFYRGRSFPTSGSLIRLLAIPHFVRADGSSVAVANIRFTWKNGTATLSSLSGVGKNSVVIPAAILYGQSTITVDAKSTDGSFSGEASVSVPTGDPQVVLYEVSPLYGIRYDQALGASADASDSETSFAAIPYFANVSNPASGLSYTWTVNGKTLSADEKNPNEITVAVQGAGVAQIALSLSSPTNPFVGASGTWNISFGNGSVQTNDVFHSAP